MITSLAAFLTASAALKCDCSVKNEYIREYVAVEFLQASANDGIGMDKTYPPSRYPPQTCYSPFLHQDDEGERQISSGVLISIDDR